MARPYDYDDSAAALLHPAAGKSAVDFFEQWGPADSARDELLAAELSRLAYAPREIVAAALPRAGLALARWFGGESFFSRLQSAGTQGFVATDPARRACVVFRGTEAARPEDLIADLMTSQSPWPGGGHVHRGFGIAYARVREQLAAVLDELRPSSILFTGHSLGAALATLAAANRPGAVSLVTFGSPRVGDAAFAAGAFRDVAISRFVGCCDVVTRVPPIDFSAPRIATLLGELYAGDGQAAATLAQAAPVLSAAFTHTLGNPHFAHAGRAAYIDREGRLQRQCDEAYMAADQAAARTAYAARHHDSPAPLATPFAAWFTSGSLGEFLAQSVAVLRNGTVPLRDLADHAPINYLRAMVGAR